jgi:hypothetical protein
MKNPLRLLAAGAAAAACVAAVVPSANAAYEAHHYDVFMFQNSTAVIGNYEGAMLTQVGTFGLTPRVVYSSSEPFSTAPDYSFCVAGKLRGELRIWALPVGVTDYKITLNGSLVQGPNCTTTKKIDEFSTSFVAPLKTKVTKDITVKESGGNDFATFHMNLETAGW